MIDSFPCQILFAVLRDDGGGSKIEKKVKKIYSPLTALNLVSTYVEYFMYGNVCHPTLEVQYLTHDLPLHQALSNLLPRCKKRGH